LDAREYLAGPRLVAVGGAKDPDPGLVKWVHQKPPEPGRQAFWVVTTAENELLISSFTLTRPNPVCTCEYSLFTSQLRAPRTALPVPGYYSRTRNKGSACCAAPCGALALPAPVERVGRLVGPRARLEPTEPPPVYQVRAHRRPRLPPSAHVLFAQKIATSSHDYHPRQ